MGARTIGKDERLVDDVHVEPRVNRLDDEDAPDLRATIRQPFFDERTAECEWTSTYQNAHPEWILASGLEVGELLVGV